jgi:hypothetical protein
MFFSEPIIRLFSKEYTGGDSIAQAILAFASLILKSYEAGRMRSCIRPMHGALKGFATKPVIRHAIVKSVSAIEVEAVYMGLIQKQSEE